MCPPSCCPCPHAVPGSPGHRGTWGCFGGALSLGRPSRLSPLLTLPCPAGGRRGARTGRCRQLDRRGARGRGASRAPPGCQGGVLHRRRRQQGDSPPRPGSSPPVPGAAMVFAGHKPAGHLLGRLLTRCGGSWPALSGRGVPDRPPGQCQPPLGPLPFSQGGEAPGAACSLQWDGS